MFERQRTRRVELSRLKDKRARLDSERYMVMDLANKKDSPEIYDEWFQSNSWQYAEIEWSRKRVISEALIKEADELLIPRPGSGDKDKWEVHNSPYPKTDDVLTREAMVELRTAIRKERRERHENIEWWVKMMGGLFAIVTGLVGALIGLVSVLNHK